MRSGCLAIKYVNQQDGLFLTPTSLNGTDKPMADRLIRWPDADTVAVLVRRELETSYAVSRLQTDHGPVYDVGKDINSSNANWVEMGYVDCVLARVIFPYRSLVFSSGDPAPDIVPLSRRTKANILLQCSLG